jgi:multicomponent Na+:H+ antiporter subunit D
MNSWLAVVTLMTSLFTGVVIFWIPEHRHRLRTAVNIGGALAKLGLVTVMLVGVAAGRTYESRLVLAPGLDLLLRVDALSLLFLTLSAFLWLLTTIYAVGYFKGKPNQSRFFGFFSLCVAATTGVALSGSLVTFFIFYELLTLATWPLVAHKGDEQSIAAGRTYLTYTLGGSALLLAGIVWLESLAGPVEFAQNSGLALVDPARLTIVFFLMVAGLSVKAALVPLHGWLPNAMVAPTPVSALLHAVAVVKAGAFGIVRVIYDVYGFARIEDLQVGIPLAVFASITIIYGSWRALAQVDIKRLLAYSTVSQVSYIVLGAALAGQAATVGGLVHLIHQGLMKITLFFCAGALAERAGITRIDQLNGVGKSMPLTMLAFSVAALGMVGAPPMAGFVSKWQLILGGLEAGHVWAVFVLATSSLLNAAYFLPLIYRAWFVAPSGPRQSGRERNWMLIWPAIITAAASVLAGLFAGWEFSPLGWARLIVEREYVG